MEKIIRKKISVTRSTKIIAIGLIGFFILVLVSTFQWEKKINEKSSSIIIESIDDKALERENAKVPEQEIEYADEGGWIGRDYYTSTIYQGGFDANGMDNWQQEIQYADEEARMREDDHFFMTYRDFPYYSGGIVYADQAIYEALKAEYAAIDFSGEFKTGDLETYDLYKEKYLLLMRNQMPFLDLAAGEPYFLKEFDEIKWKDEAGKEIDDIACLFFDIDSDGTPELCIEQMRYLYIFKYLPDKNEHILWRETWAPSCNELLGTKEVCWEGEGEMAFCMKDQNGLDDCYFYFFEHTATNWKNEEESVYMVTFPGYRDQEKKMKITPEMAQQGYFDDRIGKYYFRVSENQYYELVGKYLNVYQASANNIESVTYTPKELFES